jgi:hypothetical protein
MYKCNVPYQYQDYYPFCEDLSYNFVVEACLLFYVLQESHTF